MVSFSCEQCADVVRKQQLDQHRERCRNSTFTCLDCSKTFQGNEYKGHTSCISEAEKYQKGMQKAKKTQEMSPDKSKQKPTKTQKQKQDIGNSNNTDQELTTKKNQDKKENVANIGAVKENKKGKVENKTKSNKGPAMLKYITEILEKEEILKKRKAEEQPPTESNQEKEKPGTQVKNSSVPNVENHAQKSKKKSKTQHSAQSGLENGDKPNDKPNEQLVKTQNPENQPIGENENGHNKKKKKKKKKEVVEPALNNEKASSSPEETKKSLKRKNELKIAESDSSKAKKKQKTQVAENSSKIQKKQDETQKIQAAEDSKKQKTQAAENSKKQKTQAAENSKKQKVQATSSKGKQTPAVEASSPPKNNDVNGKKKNKHVAEKGNGDVKSDFKFSATEAIKKIFEGGKNKEVTLQQLEKMAIDRLTADPKNTLKSSELLQKFKESVTFVFKDGSVLLK